MASLEHKSRTPREKVNRTGQTPSTQHTSEVQETPIGSQQKPDGLGRLVFTVWILAFAFLGSLALWNLVTAVLFR